MFLSEFVEYIGGIKAGIVTQLSRDDLKCLCHGTDQKLFLAGDGPRVVSQIFTQLHLNGSTTCNGRPGNVVYSIFNA